MPSNIYWQGLGAWGIRQFRGSQAQYHASLDGYYRQLSASQRNDDGGLVEDAVEPNWHRGLPRPPDDFPQGFTFNLTEEEATYLRDRISMRVPGTFLAFLVGQATDISSVSFPWQHPLFGALPEALAGQLDHARCFSETMHGAALVYNLMLAELRDAAELIDWYRAAIQKWDEMLRSSSALLARWNRAQFWETIRRCHPRLSPVTRQFADRWIDLALASNPATTISDSSEVRDLIRRREQMLKGQLARLTNRRALELWNGAAGIDPISYRWRNAQVILNDIIVGLSLTPQPESDYA